MGKGLSLGICFSANGLLLQMGPRGARLSPPRPLYADTYILWGWVTAALPRQLSFRPQKGGIGA